MFSEGAGKVLKQVITSWEVIFVTLAFILFVFIVNYVSRSYRRPRAKKPAVKKKKTPPAPAAETSSPSNSNDDLIIEED